jgi:hypothetical protein
MQDASDSWITLKVKSTYGYSSHVDGSDIEVGTTDGVVTLRGTVESGVEEDLTIELAGHVRGVRSVNSVGLKHSDSGRVAAPCNCRPATRKNPGPEPSLRRSGPA